MNGDPFHRANPLGPGTMLRAYRSGATAVRTGLTYADLVREQAPLDLTGIDAGLAVTVAAHQTEIDEQAGEFVDTVVADYIQLASDVGNFAALMAAFGGDAATMRQLSTDQRWDGVHEALSSVADAAGENGVDGDTAIDHIDTVRSEVRRSGRRLDAVLKLAVSALDDDAKAATARIDTLTEKISKNISAIVDGATETGGAFTSLGIGVLTILAKDVQPTPPKADTKADTKDDDDGAGDDDEPAASDATDGDQDDDGDGDAAEADDDARDDEAPDDSPDDGDDDDGDGDDGDGDDGDDDVDDEDASTTNSSDGLVPDVSFVVSAIKAGSEGTEKFAGAIAALNTNNDRLALEYQRLASSNRLVAVAKATQAQKTLFASSVNDTATALRALRDEWSSVQRSVATWSTKSSAADAAELARLTPGALKQWKAVAAELDAIKQAMTRSRRAR